MGNHLFNGMTLSEKNTVGTTGSEKLISTSPDIWKTNISGRRLHIPGLSSIGAVHPLGEPMLISQPSLLDHSLLFVYERIKWLNAPLYLKEMNIEKG